jgi:hypothetical protein
MRINYFDNERKENVYKIVNSMNLRGGEVVGSGNKKKIKIKLDDILVHFWKIRTPAFQNLL